MALLAAGILLSGGSCCQEQQEQRRTRAGSASVGGIMQSACVPIVNTASTARELLVHRVPVRVSQCERTFQVVPGCERTFKVCPASE